MKLREFMLNLNYRIAERPELLDLQVVSAKDEEGNGFNLVHYQPTIGNYENGEFIGENNDDPDQEELETNAICIN